MADIKLKGFGMENDDFATIKVIGIGGGGCNAVNRMIECNIKGIEFIAINTDNQALQKTKASNKLQIGERITLGIGAGADPEVGELAASESKEDISRLIDGTDMLFITAGMGGGTGTGGAPIVAQIAKELGILTVGVVTRPFRFEGSRRMMNAEEGIREMEKFVDSLIVVPNDKLLEVAGDDMTFDEALYMADQVLSFGVSGISDLVAIPGLINLDLADIRRIMTSAGVCHMGIGKASGPGRATVAVKQAIHSPLLDTTIDGAHGVIMNFTGGRDMKLHEVDEAASVIRDAVSPDADIIFGAVISPELTDEIIITVIASGFSRENLPSGYRSAMSAKTQSDKAKSEEMNILSTESVKEDIPEFLSSITEEEVIFDQEAGKKPTPGNSASGFLTIGDPDETAAAEGDKEIETNPVDTFKQAFRSRVEFQEPDPKSSQPAPIRPEKVNPQETGKQHQKKRSHILPWFLQENDR